MQQSNKTTFTLVVLFASAFIAAFNENIVNVALTGIIAEFDVSTITAQWLVTGYMIVASVVVAIMAYLSRRFTLRTLFFSASAILVIGSVGCYFAPNFGVLLAARLFQAIGTGVFIPTMMSTVMIVAPREKVGSMMAVGSCCITLGPAFGPVLSGIMVSWLGWRGIFLPPCVAMAIVFICSLFCIHNIVEPSKPRLDPLSLTLMVVGLTLVVYGLTQLTTALLIAIVSILVGIGLLVIFGKRQMKLDEPLMNVKPLFHSTFTLACILAVVAMATTFSMSVLMPLYFQDSLMKTALVSGLLVLVPLICNAISALFAGRIYDRFGEWPLLPAGFLLIVVGQLCVCLMTNHVSLPVLMVFICLSYLGVGFVLPPSQTAALKRLAPADNPHGVSILSVFIQVAGALGPSLFVGVYSSSTNGFGAAVGVSAGIAVVGFLVAFFYARKVK